LVPDEEDPVESVELEPDGAVDVGPEPDVVVSVEELGGIGGDVAGGGTAVGGDAAGVRSAGRSLTDPVPLSVQPPASVATSARAGRLSNARFMDAPPLLCRTRAEE
jgi:hypothetical protein